MTEEQIQKMFDEAVSTQDFARKRQLLDALVKENPENADVQAAQVMLGGLYFQGKGGAPRDLTRAEQLLRNPADHGHSQALLQLALIHYQSGMPDAVGLFCRAWATGGTGAEAAAARLEELRQVGARRNQDFLRMVDREIDVRLTALRKKIREGEDRDGSAEMAVALYYIYALNGREEENLQLAYDCLTEALTKGNPLASIYLKRTAFSYMENPLASARLLDADTDYASKPEPPAREYDGAEEEGEAYEPEETKHSFFQAANMPDRIYGPYNRVYHRFASGLRSADYICREDNDLVTIRDEDIQAGIMGYSATISAGYFYW